MMTSLFACIVEIRRTSWKLNYYYKIITLFIEVFYGYFFEIIYFTNQTATFLLHCGQHVHYVLSIICHFPDKFYY